MWFVTDFVLWRLKKSFNGQSSDLPHQHPKQSAYLFINVLFHKKNRMVEDIP